MLIREGKQGDKSIENLNKKKIPLVNKEHTCLSIF